MKQLLTLLFLLSLFESQHLIAQSTFSEQDLQGMKFRLVGPTRGGRVSTVSGVRGELFTFYMGTTGGGVWKTTDAGTSWKNISDKYFKVGSIGAIAVAPSDPNVIYVGTGSPDPRGNVSAGKGVYKSTDAGETWTFLGMEDAGQVGRIIVHPTDADKVWVGVLGNIFGPGPTRGVYYSDDGGTTFEKILYVDDRTGCIDLAIDRDNPRVLYAAMWTAQRKPWTFIDGSATGGLWKSKDSGKTWSKLEGGLPTGVIGRMGIAVSPVNSRRVWVIVETPVEEEGGLYRSDDGGTTFKRVNRAHKLRQRAWYYNRVEADPKDEHTVYVMNVGFHKSIDGGASFKRISTHHGDNHALWINPDHPNIMIEGNDGGAQVTVNGGKTWSTLNNQPTAEFYRLTIDNDFPYNLYAAQQDNSTMKVPSRALAGLTSTSSWESVGGGESGHIAVDPRNSSRVFASTYAGIITRIDPENGYLGGNINAYPQLHDGTAFRDMEHRFQWNAPVRISPHNPDKLYHCSQYVHVSMDSGQNWEIISPDLTTNQDAYQGIPGGPVQHDHTGVEVYTSIFAFEESPINEGELWAGTDDGRIHISRDNGDNWKEITPVGMPLEGTVNMIDLSATQAGRALVAIYKYRDNDFRPYIFLTNDYGTNWRRLTNGKNGIPDDHFVRVVREDPNREGLLYAGTEYGLYFSTDEGRNWQSLQLNLPITPITDLQIKNTDLVVATQGRAFWILDDLSPLYDKQLLAAAENPVLVKPAPAYRYQSSGRRATPDKIPYGAIIYYYLATVPEENQEIRIEIKDRVGQVRKVFSSQPDKKQKEEKLTVKKGLNRLVWDLKYEAPNTIKGSQFSISSTGGIKAPAGAHTIVITSGNYTQSQPLEIKLDPRWLATSEDIEAQYELGMKVKDLLNESHEAIRTLRSIRTQIADLTERSQQNSLSKEINDKGSLLKDQITELEKQLIQVKTESSQDPINYPPMLDNQIAYLYSVVNAYDNHPAKGQYQRLEDLENEYAVHRNSLTTIKEEVKRFNELLVKAGVMGVVLEARD